MIDFILGAILGGCLIAAYFHFKGESPAKRASDLSSLSNLELRIQQTMTQVFDDAMTKLSAAVEAAKAKAVEDYKAANPPVDPAPAVAAQEQADAATVENFANQIAPPV